MKVVPVLLAALGCSLVTSAAVVARSGEQAVDEGDAWCGHLQVGLAVSPLLDGRSRRLELWWDGARPRAGDWVGLFGADPAASGGLLAGPLFAVSAGARGSGWVTSEVHQPDLPASPGLATSGPQCLGAWVAYVAADNRSVLASSCLRTRPTWMAEMNATISSLKLQDIFLPGTHDSGSYNESPGKETLVARYTITQEEDTLDQLIYGIRYLDVRVGYYPYLNPQWWVNHWLFRIHPLQQLVDHVKRFVLATNEIVIFDVHEFPVGFGSNLMVHALLEGYLQEQLGSLATPKALSWKSTLGEVWGSGRRLIVSYNQQHLVDGSTWLWPAVAQQWGNVDTLDKLHDYLAFVMNKQFHNIAWAAMAELTASADHVIYDTLGGLRKMADSVNRNVTVWYKGSWGKTVNIVAVDFFRGTGIVDAAIQWNERRGSNASCPRWAPPSSRSRRGPILAAPRWVPPVSRSRGQAVEAWDTIDFLEHLGLQPLPRWLATWWHIIVLSSPVWMQCQRAVANQMQEPQAANK
ncbi:PI-PLC X domain-containing protein 1-like isoform X2 [Bacillus rossius redtenbacheri]|uniref:PI-PLC X domain-containing protein 1-like isoform X2 n=1 Tax=Bacillus rossius redtenbacheri TaxID=93214 RepID=UPI002FDE909F